VRRDSIKAASTIAASQYTKEKDYWVNHLSGELVRSHFPYVFNRKSNENQWRKNTLEFEFPGDISNKLLKISNNSDNRLFMIILVGMVILIHKYTGNNDIIVGVPVYKQDDIEGEFVNTVLPIRNRLSGNFSFKELLLKVRETFIDANDYQNYPIKTLLYQLNIPYSEEDDFPLFDIAMLLTNIHNKSYIEDIHLNVIFSVSRKTDGLINGGVEYNSQVYDKNTIQQIISHYLKVCIEVLANPEMTIADIQLLTEKERKKVLYSFNVTETPYPKEKTIHQLLEEQVEKTPEARAVIQGDQSLSYRELNTRANGLARRLKELGVTTNILVGLMVETSIDTIVGILGILKAGGAYLPIEPDYPPDRKKFMIQDSNLKQLVTTEFPKDKHQDILRLFPPENTFFLDKEETYGEGAGNPLILNNPGSLVYVIYTSGTTGKPKGVMVEQQGLVNYIYWADKSYVKDQKLDFPLYTSISFDLTVTSIFTPLVGGNAIVIYESEDKEISIKRVIEEDVVGVVKLTPSHLKLIRDTHIIKGNFSNIKCFIVGGEKLDTGLAMDIHKLTADKVEIYNEYGPTETVVGCMIYRFNPRQSQWDSVPIGKPTDNTQVYLLDENSVPVPYGVGGEIHISGDGVARGYMNRVTLTNQKFIPNPFIKGQVSYKTGDLARWLPDGNIEYTGRIDHQVKLRSFRIELGEIESQLQKKEEIRNAVVLMRENSENEKYLCAYIVTDDDINPVELRMYLLEYLPDYMIPNYFIGVENIPLTANGKVDRNALPEPRLMARAEYIPPKNKVEAHLVEIWKDVLGRENIGTNESFFMVGGDSIRAIQISARMNSAGYKIRLRDIFQNPSIAELAPIVKKASRPGIQSAVSGAVLLTPRQHWFFKEKCIDNHHFNQAIMLYSREGFDENGIKAAFEKIQAHHDVLRIVFNEENGTFRQEIKGLGFPISLSVHDLRNCENAVEIMENKANNIQESINLQKGPLMKLGLFYLDDGDRLLIVIHHLVIDGVSWRLLFEDMETLYHQYRTGEEFELPLKTDSFKLWSEKLSVYANSEEFLKEKIYWQKLELMEATVPPIEKDFDEDCNYEKDSETLSFNINEEQTNLLLTKVHEAFGTEINDILLISLGLGIKRTWGHTRLLVALEGHGREDIADLDISRTIGWFTSVYPVILDFSYENDLSLLVKKVKEMLRQIPNRGIGYEILKYLTSVEHKAGLTFKLEPQVSFNYLGQFDRDVEGKTFTIARESAGNSTSLKGKRNFEIEINGITANKQLIMTITYNKNHFRKKSIQALANHFKDELIRVISYCSNRETKQLTPSDLTYKSLSIEELDRLTGKYPVKDIWPLSPMQEGIYFIVLVEDSSFAYFEQMSYHLHGHLNIPYVENSLNELLKRYDILRTAFIHETFDCPLQIVLTERKIDFYYKDIRNLTDKKEKAAFIEQFKVQDKQRYFDLGKDVLIRVSILQPKNYEYEFIWSFHHILIDGWCVGILISDFLEIYNSFLEGRACQLPNLKQFNEYLRWLEKQDREAPKNYWRKYLEAYHQAVVIPGMNADIDNHAEYKRERVILRIEKEETAVLNDLARKNQVTVNTIVQTVWGILLGKYNYTQDIVFGIVVSGRPTEVDEIESMVGLFLNVVPLRVRFKEDVMFNDLLRQIQEDTINMNQYHYLPLAEIQSLSSLKKNLINHALVFENYPLYENKQENNPTDKKGVKLEITEIDAFEQGNYNFFLAVLPGETLRMALEYNGNVYDSPGIEKIASHFKSILDQIIDNPFIEIQNIKISQDLLLANVDILEENNEDFRF
jgi:iturin family lipopeptide synthetase C